MFVASFSLILRRPLASTLFPYTTLFRSHFHNGLRRSLLRIAIHVVHRNEPAPNNLPFDLHIASVRIAADRKINGLAVDRKSTRLNSSHRTISYAVFCLKKKM